MKKILLILSCTLIVSACGVAYRAKKLSGVYVSASIDPKIKDTGGSQSNYLILKKNGNFLESQMANGYVFRGHWTFTAKKQILLKCNPPGPPVYYDPLAPPREYITLPDRNIEIINKNRLRVNNSDSLIFDRILYR